MGLYKSSYLSTAGLHLRYAKFFEPFYQISKSVCEEAGNNGKDWATRARLVRIGLEGEPGGLVGWRMKFYQVWLGKSLFLMAIDKPFGGYAHDR